MSRTPFLFPAAVLVVGAATLGAQAPNFGGSWTRIVDPNASAIASGDGPDGLTIVQDSETITIVVHTMRGNDSRSVLNLDGTDTKQTLTDGDGNQSEYVSRAKWDGSRLVVTRVRTLGGTNATATITYSLDAAGELTVVVALPTGAGAKPNTISASFKKS